MAIGDRIKRARLAAGLSQQALADAVGVSKNAISKYERGESVPGSNVLLGLCRELRKSVDFFFRPIEVTVTCGAYRKQSRLPAKRQKAIEAQIVERLERYLEVEELLEIHSDLRPEGRPTLSSPEEAEEAALALRQEWKLGLDPLGNLSEILEQHAVKVFLFDEPDPKFAGWSCWANGRHPVTVANANATFSPPDRQRFTLAHELAHVWFELPEDASSEAVAHRFAGAFIVPSEAARGEYAQRSRLDDALLYELKHRWGLSMAGWVFRLKDLGLVSASAAKQYWIHRNNRGWNRREPLDAERLRSERTTRLTRLVAEARAQGLVTDARAMELDPSLREVERELAGE